MGIRPARGKKGDDEEPKKPQGGRRPANAEFFQTNDQGAYVVPDFEDADKKGEENHYCRAHLTDKYGNRMKDGQGKLLMCPQSGNFSTRRSLKDHLCRTHREQGRPVEVERRSPGKAKGRQGQAKVYNGSDNLTSQTQPSSNHEFQNGYQSHGGAQYEYPSPSRGAYNWKEESRQPRIFKEPAPQYQQHSNERLAHSPAQSGPTSTYSEPAIEVPNSTMPTAPQSTTHRFPPSGETGTSAPAPAPVSATNEPRRASQQCTRGQPWKLQTPATK